MSASGRGCGSARRSARLIQKQCHWRMKDSPRRHGHGWIVCFVAGGDIKCGSRLRAFEWIKAFQRINFWTAYWRSCGRGPKTLLSCPWVPRRSGEWWSTRARLLDGLEALKDVNRRARGVPPGRCRRGEAGAMEHDRRHSCPNPIEMRSPYGCGGSR